MHNEYYHRIWKLFNSYYCFNLNNHFLKCYSVCTSRPSCLRIRPIHRILRCVSLDLHRARSNLLHFSGSDRCRHTSRDSTTICFHPGRCVPLWLQARFLNAQKLQQSTSQINDWKPCVETIWAAQYQCAIWYWRNMVIGNAWRRNSRWRWNLQWTPGNNIIVRNKIFIISLSKMAGTVLLN